MGFIPSANSLINQQKVLGKSAVTSVINNTFNQNAHTKSIEDFKNSLGMGFRPNLFTIEFLFNKSFHDELKNQNNIIMPSETPVDGKLDDLSDKINGGVDKLFGRTGSASYNDSPEEKVAFPLLCTQFQLPAITLQQTENIIRYVKHIKDSETGPITATILNDQWNYNYSFIHNYVTSICDGEMVYHLADEYKFTIVVYMYSSQWKVFQEHRIEGCTILGKPDLDLNKGAVGEIPSFSLSIDWQDYSIKTTRPTFKNVFFYKPYDEDLNFIIKNFTTSKLKSLYVDASEQLKQKYSKELVAYYERLVIIAKKSPEYMSKETTEIIEKFETLISQSK